MSKSELQIEVTALRKQVADLKEAAAVRWRLESALRASEELVRSTLDDCPIPLCRLDESGKLMLANPALARLLGYGSRHELLELVPVLGLFADPSQFACIKKSTAKQSGLEMIAGLRRKEGEICQALIRLNRSGSPPVYTIAVWEPTT